MVKAFVSPSIGRNGASARARSGYPEKWAERQSGPIWSLCVSLQKLDSGSKSE
jgi:hypothetical protein